MTASLKKGSKVFELLEGGAAARNPGRRKLNVFARWARAKFYSRSPALIARVVDESDALIQTQPSEGSFREPRVASWLDRLWPLLKRVKVGPRAIKGLKLFSLVAAELHFAGCGAIGPIMAD